MPLETGTQIGQLDPANPPGTDPVSQADDHLRLIKVCVQGSLGEMVEIWGIPTNDLPLKGLNAAGDGYVEMIKVDDQDNVLVAGIQPQDKLTAFKRNHVINGGMQISQRGPITQTGAGGGYGGCDRMRVRRSGFTSGSLQMAQAGGTVNAGVISQSGFIQQVRLTSAVGTGNVTHEYRMEAADAAKLVGRTVTFSATVLNTSGLADSGTFNVYKPNALDDWTGSTFIAGEAFAETAGARVPVSVTRTLTLDDVQNGIGILIQFTNVTTDAYMQIGDMQIKESSEVLPWSSAGAGQTEELAMCQRYFWQGTPQFNDFYYGTAGLAAMTGGKFSFPATMRDVPSMALVTAGADSGCTFEGVFGKIDSLTVRVTVDATGRYRYTEGEYSADAEL